MSRIFLGLASPAVLLGTFVGSAMAADTVAANSGGAQLPAPTAAAESLTPLPQNTTLIAQN
ncbi:MAG: porin, partial [Cyanobacteria bacterium J003]